MADENTTIRIKDQPEDSVLANGDYVIVDSQNEGTRKYNLGKEIRDIKEDLSQLEEYEIYVQGTSLIINTNLINGNEVNY